MSSGPQQFPSSTAEEADEIEELEQEVGDRDPTYLRTRLVFSYDYKQLEAPISTNRFRLKLLYAFGPKQRLGLSVLQPVIQTDTPLGTASGFGNTEVQAIANVYTAERFRTGAAVQATFETSGDSRLGGASTMKPSWDVAWVLSSRVEVTGAFSYKQSIHTTHGIPVKQNESDITVNTQLLDATWFVESDSYYDFISERYAQTMKGGISNRFGKNRRWVVSAYYSRGVNDYGRQSQHQYNVGLDATWYPLKNR